LSPSFLSTWGKREEWIHSFTHSAIYWVPVMWRPWVEAEVWRWIRQRPCLGSPRAQHMAQAGCELRAVGTPGGMGCKLVVGRVGVCRAFLEDTIAEMSPFQCFNIFPIVLATS
jgi:hypothetical protein